METPEVFKGRRQMLKEVLMHICALHVELGHCPHMAPAPIQRTESKSMKSVLDPMHRQLWWARGPTGMLAGLCTCVADVPCSVQHQRHAVESAGFAGTNGIIYLSFYRIVTPDLLIMPWVTYHSWVLQTLATPLLLQRGMWL